MRIGGRGTREHLQLLAPLFGVLAAIWILRWLLGAADAPRWITGALSLTVAAPVSILLAVLLMHVRRFGSYANVVVASLLLNAWTQVLIIAAIVVSVATGVENIYTAPEFSLRSPDPYHVRHIYGHLTFGLALSTLIGAGVGCFLLFLLRRMVPMPGAASKGAES